MLGNRKIAWIITAFVMIFGVFFGSYRTYRQMHQLTTSVFSFEMEPMLREKIEMLYHMITLYRLNVYQLPGYGDEEEIIVNALKDIEILQFQMERYLPSIPMQANKLLVHAHNLYLWADSVGLSGSDAQFIRNFHTDMRELAQVLSQSQYNQLAEDFNTATQRGLGFLTHNAIAYAILQNYGQLPVFIWDGHSLYGYGT